MLIAYDAEEAEAVSTMTPSGAIAITEACNLMAKVVRSPIFYKIKPALIIAAWKLGADFGIRREPQHDHSIYDRLRDTDNWDELDGETTEQGDNDEDEEVDYEEEEYEADDDGEEDGEDELDQEGDEHHTQAYANDELEDVYYLSDPIIGTASFHDPDGEVKKLIGKYLKEEIPKWPYKWSGVIRQDDAFNILESLSGNGMLAESYALQTLPNDVKTLRKKWMRNRPGKAARTKLGEIFSRSRKT